MKNIKLMLVIPLFSLTLMLPALVTTQAFADQQSQALECYSVEDPTTEGCDLALTKQVSVNGSSYTEAETTATAPSAKVGDTISYKVTVTNDSDTNLVPQGSVTVTDNLPNSLTLDSAVASAGTYTDGSWTFDLSGNLPATLTLTTTANSAGVIENIAALTGYTASEVDPPYTDANNSNNSDEAYVDVSAVPKPVVTPPVTTAAVTPGTPNTGFGVFGTNPLRILSEYLLAAFAALSLAFATRRLYKKQGKEV